MTINEQVAEETTRALNDAQYDKPYDMATRTLAAVDGYLSDAHCRTLTLAQYRALRSAIAAAINYDRTINEEK